MILPFYTDNQNICCFSASSYLVEKGHFINFESASNQGYSMIGRLN